MQHCKVRDRFYSKWPGTGSDESTDGCFAHEPNTKAPPLTHSEIQLAVLQHTLSIIPIFVLQFQIDVGVYLPLVRGVWRAIAAHVTCPLKDNVMQCQYNVPNERHCDSMSV